VDPFECSCTKAVRAQEFCESCCERLECNEQLKCDEKCCQSSAAVLGRLNLEILATFVARWNLIG
jgi:hypothetical protein